MPRGTEVGYVEVQNMLQSLRDAQSALEVEFNATQTPPTPAATVRRYIFPGWDWTHTEGSGSIALVNDVRCYRFRIFDAYAGIISLTTYENAFNTTADYGVWAIYSGDGTELLCQFPEIQGTAGIAQAVTSADLAQPIDLEPGDYWLAWSGPGLNGLETAFNGPVASWLVIANAAEVRLGKAQFKMIGATPPFTMPSGLGTVAVEAGIGVPAVRINTREP